MNQMWTAGTTEEPIFAPVSGSSAKGTSFVSRVSKPFELKCTCSILPLHVGVDVLCQSILSLLLMLMRGRRRWCWCFLNDVSDFETRWECGGLDFTLKLVKNKQTNKQTNCFHNFCLFQYMSSRMSDFSTAGTHPPHKLLYGQRSCPWMFHSVN